MIKPPPMALGAALNVALSEENTWDEESRSYRCHACGSRTDSSPVGGCTNPECWVESAEILQRVLAPPKRSVEK